MLVVVKKDHREVSGEAARVIANMLREKPSSVLGLATGSTPLELYKELIRMHKDEGLDFSQVTTFNLDEYVGLPAKHDQSYHYFMRENLFKHINVPQEKVHIPSAVSLKSPLNAVAMGLS